MAPKHARAAAAATAATGSKQQAEEKRPAKRAKKDGASQPLEPSTKDQKSKEKPSYEYFLLKNEPEEFGVETLMSQHNQTGVW